MKGEDFNTKYQPTWCPGCGDYGIWTSLKEALVRLGFRGDDFVIVYGIGCSGNMNDFVKSYGFHSLHGRAIANSVGIHLANHKLPVICVVGDGDCYGEGGNHLVHACRGNFDITVIACDNRVYGLTTGQAAPTADSGYKSKSTPAGIIEAPLNPLSLAITCGATFVAQGFAGDIPHLTDLIAAGAQHKGFSLVNVLQPCMSFNKVNTYNWYRQRIYKLNKSYNPENKINALKTVLAPVQKIPLGVLYRGKRAAYKQSLPQLKKKTLVEQKLRKETKSLFEEFI